MSEGSSSSLKPSTRIAAGLFMLIVGFACVAFVMLLGGILGYSAILPLLGGPLLASVGIFQMILGLRQRAR